MESLQLRLQDYSISYPLNFNHGRALRKAAHNYNRYKMVLLVEIFSLQIVPIFT